MSPLLWIALLLSAPAMHDRNATQLADDSSYVGGWEGVYHSGHAPDGAIRLTLVHGTDWTAKLDLPAVPVGAATAVHVEGTRLVWKQELMSAPCDAVAERDGAALRGKVTCAFGAISFEMTRKAP